MKLYSGKLQFWEWKSPQLVPEHSVPRPCWFFTFLHAGRPVPTALFHSQNCNFPEEGFIFYILCSQTSWPWSWGKGQDRYTKGREFNTSLLTLSLFSQGKSPENSSMSSGMEECKMPDWARYKMFPSPDRWLQRHPVRVAESCVRSCYSVHSCLPFSCTFIYPMYSFSLPTIAHSHSRSFIFLPKAPFLSAYSNSSFTFLFLKFSFSFPSCSIFLTFPKIFFLPFLFFLLSYSPVLSLLCPVTFLLLQFYSFPFSAVLLSFLHIPFTPLPYYYGCRS